MMLKKFKKWLLSKSEEEDVYEIYPQLPKEEDAKFQLKVDNISIGILSCSEGVWHFKYSDEFKRHSNEYNHIVGFSDLDKTYQSEVLWPFFQIRIPGLKQPAVQEILKKERIDENNEVALLRRFGRRTISNPYELVAR
jgi:HipA-like protein